MTGDIGDYWREHDEALKERKRASRAAFDPTGWTQLNENHFKRVTTAGRFDYWPSTGTVEWHGKYFRGIRPPDIEAFIRNRVGAA
jgi:hypothetical protein